jgi:hypothetical protein
MPAARTAISTPTSTVPSDPNAQGFYVKMGAQRVGEVPSRPPGRTLPLLVLRLTDANRE